MDGSSELHHVTYKSTHFMHGGDVRIYTVNTTYGAHRVHKVGLAHARPNYFSFISGALHTI